VHQIDHVSNTHTLKIYYYPVQHAMLSILLVAFLFWSLFLSLPCSVFSQLPRSMLILLSGLVKILLYISLLTEFISMLPLLPRPVSKLLPRQESKLLNRPVGRVIQNKNVIIKKEQRNYVVSWCPEQSPLLVLS